MWRSAAGLARILAPRLVRPSISLAVRDPCCWIATATRRPGLIRRIHAYGLARVERDRTSADDDILPSERGTGLFAPRRLTDGPARSKLVRLKADALAALAKAGASKAQREAVLAQHEVSLADVVAFLKEEHDGSMELSVLDVSLKCTWVDAMIFVTASSQRHMKAMANELWDVLRGRPYLAIDEVAIEGKDSSNWIIVDGGQFVAHFFTAEGRDEYRVLEHWTSLPDRADRTVVLQGIGEDRAMGTLQIAEEYTRSSAESVDYVATRQQVHPPSHAQAGRRKRRKAAESETRNADADAEHEEDEEDEDEEDEAENVDDQPEPVESPLVEPAPGRARARTRARASPRAASSKTDEAESEDEDEYGVPAPTKQGYLRRSRR